MRGWKLKVFILNSSFSPRSESWMLDSLHQCHLMCPSPHWGPELCLSGHSACTTSPLAFPREELCRGVPADWWVPDQSCSGTQERTTSPPLSGAGAPMTDQPLRPGKHPIDVKMGSMKTRRKSWSETPLSSQASVIKKWKCLACCCAFHTDIHSPMKGGLISFILQLRKMRLRESM